jgi:hypothetical protein
MNYLENISTDKFINLVNNYKEKSDRYFITVLGWQGGDYFEELCEENGGIDKAKVELFKNKPLGKKVLNFSELINEIEFFQRNPFLESKNGKYRYSWDLYLWFGKCHIIYNAELEKVEIHKQNFIARLFHLGKQPSWL